ncbi:hypothetical protein Bca101_020373 [Brassica carinata]
MIAKAERCFHRIRLREDLRDKYDDARCLFSQAFGTRKCLEQIRDSGVEIPRATVDIYAEQERHFREEAVRLEIDPYGSNTDLIDSEAAFALRTPCNNPAPRSEGRERELVLPAGSTNRCVDLEGEPASQVAENAVVPRNENAPPTVVLTNSPAKASVGVSSSSSSSGEAKTGGRSPEGPRANPPSQPFGRVSGPEGPRVGE